MGLLEYSIELSPSNFDFQLCLASIYDSLGASFSFGRCVQLLGLKGVQLESMGHLLVRHAVEWADLQMIETNVNTKY